MNRVTIIGTCDAKSEEIHRARAQALADFFDVDIVLKDLGNIEEMTFIRGDKKIVLQALGNRCDGGYFAVKEVDR